jgi:hypothetical protein
VVIEEATAGLTPKQVGKAKEATYSGFTSEALMEERLKDRSAWVAKYNSRGGAAASGISSEAALGDRVKVRYTTNWAPCDVWWWRARMDALIHALRTLPHSTWRPPWL